MINISSKVSLNIILTSSMMLILTACDLSPKQEYSINITNLTHSQPISPPVAMLHRKDFSFWSVGTEASEALEMMAEGGDGSSLLTLKPQNPQYQGTTPLFPGESTEFTLDTRRDKLKYLSVAGMLINTNDAFSGVNGIELLNLEAGQTSVYYTNTYDAGTELNSELSGTIPGPADGGEGFNATRDDVTSVVTYHGGIVSADDNFADSTLRGADKFDNPTLRIVITAH